MNMFAKIFSQILDSSIAENYQTRHMFMDLLVLADPQGAVDMTMQGISRRTNIPLKMVRASIEELLKPDPCSRSKESEGRRIVPLDAHRDWGWQIVNYEHYRNLLDEEARRSYFRDRKRLQRAAQKSSESPSVSDKIGQSETVRESLEKSPKVTQEEEEVEEEVEGEEVLSPSKSRERVATTKVFWSIAEGWSGISEDQKAEWKEAFPACDIERQLREMAVWLKANPARAKKSNWLRFVARWLSKEQDRGGDKQHGAYQHNNSGGNRSVSSRSVGTLNEGKSGQYRGIGRVKSIPDSERSAVG